MGNDRPDRTIYIYDILLFMRDILYLFGYMFRYLPELKPGRSQSIPIPNTHTHTYPIDWMCTMHKPILDKKRWIEWREKKNFEMVGLRIIQIKRKNHHWLDLMRPAGGHTCKRRWNGQSYSQGILDFDSYFRLYNAKCWNGDDQKSSLYTISPSIS